MLNSINTKIYFLILFLNSLIRLSTQLENVKFNKNQIEFQNGILIEIESIKLKQTYPDLVKFLNEDLSENSSTNRKDLLNANNFIYLNKLTNNYEGVSMHSSYSVLQLAENNVFTLVTSDSLNAKLNEPFYHQFIYSIKISHSTRLNENKKDLVDILNEQSIEASHLRVSLIRKLSSLLDLTANSVRINWIEKARLSEDDFLRETLDENKQENNSKNYDEDDLEDDDADNINEEFSSKEKDNDANNDYNYDVDTNIEPEFISEFSAERLRKQNANNRKNHYLMLISFSDLKLLELQHEFFSLKKSNFSLEEQHLNAKYDARCNHFFNTIKQKHLDLLKLNYKFFNLFELSKQQIDLNEKLKRVHLVKLCDLNELNKQINDQKHISNYTKSSIINNLLSSSSAISAGAAKQISLIRNATEEISFFSNNFDYLDTVNSNETTFIDDIQSNLLIQYKDYTNTNTNSTKLGEQNDKIDDLYQLKYSIINNMTSGTTNSSDIYLQSSFKEKSFIWSIIPEEDILLAVIVPCVIIVSMTVMTIIVICLLQMYNNEKTNKNFTSITNSSENSNLTNLTSDKHNYNKPQTLYKEKAFLSKGVPVILYEEMSEKPIDDYDESNKDTMDCAHFRSPSTFRNEKPPAPLTPAPPEYSRTNQSSTISNPISNIASYTEENEPLFSNSNYADCSKKKNSNSIKQHIQQLNYILP